MSLVEPKAAYRVSPIRRIAARFHATAKAAYGEVRAAFLKAVNFRETLARARRRAAVEDQLRDIALASSARFQGRVLVDALFDNPNFWYRWTLVRAALGLAYGDEIGVTGAFNARLCAATLRRMGTKRVLRLRDFRPPERAARAIAKALLATTQTADDILAWRLPFDFPAAQAYDHILKWQRGATVDVGDPRLEDFLVECLRQLMAADRLLEETGVSLVLISQPINFDEGGLAWCASRRSIASIVVTGHGGLTRLRKGFSPARVFAGGERPSLADMAALDSEQRRKLAAWGAAYLDKRQRGLIAEISAQYAYQKRVAATSREALAREYGWDPHAPIVMVYAANWFDFPHAFGMANFRDFLDWTQVVLEVALARDDVNWLFKAHPTDEWYGGLTLDDVMPVKLPSHVRVASRTASSRDLIASVDALTTVHGTSGLEFVSAGKPVLLADRGWYHDIGIGRWARTRAEYVSLLKSAWWRDVDVAKAQEACFVFAGLLYCCPSWQQTLVCNDDTDKSALYLAIPKMLAAATDELEREVAAIATWFAEGGEGFHMEKMRAADDYRLANLVERQ